MAHLYVTTVNTGDTKRFKVTITDYDETTLVDADGDVTFNAYELNTNYLIHTGTATHSSTGIYYYNYTFPNAARSYYIEFVATLNGNTQLARIKVNARVRTT